MSDIVYNRVNWEDSPSTNTPINSTNLNVMDKGIKDVTNEVNNRISYENLLTLDECNAVTESGIYVADAMALSELGKSVSDGKRLVATAITGKGVATESNASFETMANNVNNIATGAVWVIPKASVVNKNEYSYNLKTVFPSFYKHLTADDFIVGVTGASGSTSFETGSGNHSVSTSTSLKLTKTYDSSTGELTFMYTAGSASNGYGGGSTSSKINGDLFCVYKGTISG